MSNVHQPPEKITHFVAWCCRLLTFHATSPFFDWKIILSSVQLKLGDLGLVERSFSEDKRILFCHFHGSLWHRLQWKQKSALGGESHNKFGCTFHFSVSSTKHGLASRHLDHVLMRSLISWSSFWRWICPLPVLLSRSATFYIPFRFVDLVGFHPTTDICRWSPTLYSKVAVCDKWRSSVCY